MNPERPSIPIRHVPCQSCDKEKELHGLRQQLSNAIHDAQIREIYYKQTHAENQALNRTKLGYEALQKELAEEKHKCAVATESLNHEFRVHEKTETALRKAEARLMCTDPAIAALTGFVNKLTVTDTGITLPEDLPLGTLLRTVEALKVELGQAQAANRDLEQKLRDKTAELQQLRARLPIDVDTKPPWDHPRAGGRPTVRIPSADRRPQEPTNRKRGRSSQGRPT